MNKKQNSTQKYNQIQLQKKSKKIGVVQLLLINKDQQWQVWKLENGLPIETDQILYGHQNQVYCIVFSKKLNWFISGCSGDDKLIFWKQIINSNKWESFSSLETVCTVWCLILRDNERQLLSSHDDGSIRVWSVRYLENLIIFEYSLQMHNSFVYQISLNESQTQLVSCSEDKQIIIWKLNKKLIWKFGYVIIKDIDDYGQRITFINDDTIIWCQNQGYIHIFQLHDSNFVENVNLQIIPNRIPSSDQYNLFPLIFNQSNQILILKHFQYIYLLQQQVNKQLKIISKPLYFESACMFGNLSDDGSQLVVWNMKIKSFIFYKLDYQ
ncbi:unnamed protein product [Paramecium pentaurelia]|uniref:Uncharacterized protein n=1 Tax=Paramecium pentaurelia TaxID=43138 RepID=A0A8S1SVL5_9CILI|nr:unnamed protein product [Paramecium pentaurelia]